VKRETSIVRTLPWLWKQKTHASGLTSDELNLFSVNVCK
jgi:hypothetical protein